MKRQWGNFLWRKVRPFFSLSLFLPLAIFFFSVFFSNPLCLVYLKTKPPFFFPVFYNYKISQEKSEKKKEIYFFPFFLSLSNFFLLFLGFRKKACKKIPPLCLFSTSQFQSFFNRQYQIQSRRGWLLYTNLLELFRNNRQKI